SDLLKAAELYGGEDENSGMRAKLAQRLRELESNKAAIEQQVQQLQAAHASTCGSIDTIRYIQGVWVPISAGPGKRDAVKVPLGSLSPVAEMLAVGEARDRHAKE